MQHRLVDIIDIDVLQELFETFSAATGTVAAVLDLDGNVLIATGWQDICVQFHRINTETAFRCRESDTCLASQLKAGQEYNVYQCRNGLVDVAVPIKVDGEHVGNLFTGQFFFSPPNQEFFRQQAAEFGFDETAYMTSLSRVPIFSQEQVERTMEFLSRMAAAIGEMGVSKLRSEAELAERKKTEMALQASEHQKRLIIETVPDLVWLKDTKGTFLACNKMFERLYGATEKEIIGKTDYDFVDRELADFFRKHDRAAMDADRALRNEEWVTFADDGRRVLLETSKTPLKDHDGEVIGVLGIARDITARKQSEEALRHAQRMEAVGQLTGGLAHDLNNVLGIISMNAEMLTTKATWGPDAVRHCDMIRKSVQRAGDLTRKLLDFSRTDATETKRVNVNEFVVGMEALIAKSLTPAINLELELSEGTWAVDIDPGDLEAALLNLALNARDAMPDGGTLIVETMNKVIDETYVERNPGSTAGEFVMVAISDTGTGMTPETRSKAFEPFFTTKEVGKGTGLGLSMVYGFVNRSGGHAKIYSELGEGTTIRLYLPRAENVEAREVRPAQHPDVLPHGNEMILVVDDEEDLANTAISSLEALGYRTVMASNGAQALQTLRQDSSIDLLFSDVIMPGGMDGFQLATEALKVRPDLTVLLTSGFTRRKEELANGEAKVASALAKTLLHKPYNVAELAVAVRHALDQPAST